MTLRTHLLTIGLLTTLATMPAMAQDSYPSAPDTRPAHGVQIVQGTVESVSGTVALLTLPMQTPSGTVPYYPPPTMQIDFSQATFEAFDGSDIGPQTLQPGERVVVAIRPSYQASSTGYQNPTYAPTWSNGNGQYGTPSYSEGQYGSGAYASVVPAHAFLIEPLNL